MDRKKFIKVASIVSASLLPVAGYIMYRVNDSREAALNDRIFNDSLDFQVMDNNLLNLHFYFINVKKSGSRLVPEKEEMNSFMIVRLPQMHVSEKGFAAADWADTVTALPGANMSGFSYLAFQLWPSYKAGESKKFRLDLDTILNWNNHKDLELITMVEWMQMKAVDSFSYTPWEKVEFNRRKVWNATIVNTEKEFTDDYYIKTKNESATLIYKKYKSIIRHLLDDNVATVKPAGNTFIPITFFELPEAVCLIPVSTRRDANGKFIKLQKNFWENKLAGKEIRGFRKYEVWHNTLFYTTPLQDTANPANLAAKDVPAKFSMETPSFRIAGLITSTEVECPVLNPQTCAQAAAAGGKNTYPTLLDKAELAYLTQLATTEIGGVKWNFSDPSYDINTTIFNKELNISESHGFFFSGLGVITHLHYYNEQAAPGIDLIEYEHIITQGRDVYIKVARLGIHNKNGKRYKHVIEGKRRINTIYDPVPGAPLQSFIELKQYCECIEEKKEYTWSAQDETTWNEANFDTPPLSTVSPDNLPVPASHRLFTPMLTNKPHFRRYPWKTIQTLETKKIPIEPYQDLDAAGVPVVVGSPECAFWFWPVHEGTLKSPRYLTSESTAWDWDNGAVKIETAFIFIRKSVLETNDQIVLKAINDSYCKIVPGDPAHAWNTRRQIAIHNSKIGFTEPLPVPAAVAGMVEPALNKVNILETEFVETYFNVNRNAAQSFSTARFPILPQLLRAKVFTDHIRDLTNKKIASVVEYHSDYLQHKFKDFEEVLKQGNPAKIILANTDAFRGVKYVANSAGVIERQMTVAYEEVANNTYGQIKDALQEAKDKLGNLVVPDIIPDTITLSELGITAPKELGEYIAAGKTILSKAEGGLQKIAGFNPVALLRGKLSDVCGLDLTAILDEILPANAGDNQTPLFEINKLVNKISEEIGKSEVYNEIQNDITLVKGKIEELERKLNGLLVDINTFRTQYNTTLNTITAAIPAADDLRNIVKTEVENLRTAAFKFVLENRYFTEAKDAISYQVSAITEMVNGEIALLKDTGKRKLAELLDFKVQVEAGLLKILAALPASAEWTEFRNHLLQITGNTYVAAIAQFYQDQFAGKTLVQLITDINTRNIIPLTITSDDTADLPGRVDYINAITLEWEPHDPVALANGLQLRFAKLVNLGVAGYIQVAKKIEDFKLIILRNSNGNQHQKAFATVIQAELTGYHDRLAIVKAIVQDLTGEKVGKLYIMTAALNEWLTIYEQKYQPMEQQLEAGLKEELLKIKTVLAAVLPYVDAVRKMDPYFYYTQRERIEKELTDNFRRIAADCITEYKDFLASVKTDVDNLYLNTPVGLSIFEEYVRAVSSYEAAPLPANLDALIQRRGVYIEAAKKMGEAIAKKPEDFLLLIISKSETYRKAHELVESYRGKWQQAEQDYKSQLSVYEQYVKDNINTLKGNLLAKLEKYIAEHADEIEKIKEARNLYKLLTSIKQQDLKYTWNTTSFRDINLGIVAFKKYSNPATTLKVDVKATTHFSLDKFPPSIDRITTYSENRLTNFGVSFLNMLTISFSEISFVMGSEQPAHFDVKIKDVRFDGSLSFVQAFQNYLKTIGKGLILSLEPDHVSLGYSLPIPAIKTPAFSFFNLSLNFDLRVYFDKRPMRFGFSLARADSKFGIAATIYAGFGFFGIAADPKRGIVEIECALEAGAWAGISIGPISGEVKLAFGFYYRKNEYGVRLEGYVVAEGRLSVWILEVSARIYLGIVSENSVVEGQCTVSYSVKLGFIKKSFSGTFHKRIAGAADNGEGRKQKRVVFHTRLLQSLGIQQGQAITTATTAAIEARYKLKALYGHPVNNTERETTLPVTEKKWKQFINTF